MECLKEEIEKAGEGSMRNQLEEDFHNGRITLSPPLPKIIVVVTIVTVVTVVTVVGPWGVVVKVLGLLGGVGGFVLTAGRVCSLCGDLGETEGVC